jgi:hypothetical protein
LHIHQLKAKKLTVLSGAGGHGHVVGDDLRPLHGDQRPYGVDQIHVREQSCAENASERQTFFHRASDTLNANIFPDLILKGSKCVIFFTIGVFGRDETVEQRTSHAPGGVAQVVAGAINSSVPGTRVAHRRSQLAHWARGRGSTRQKPSKVIISSENLKILILALILWLIIYELLIQ